MIDELSATRRGFGSDNHSGVHPDVLQAILVANDGHVPAYGDDVFTEQATAILKGHLGDDIDVRFVFNGTGANVSSLAALCPSWGSVICAETAHINVDECGAPEHIAGVKLVPVATSDGKLTPELVKPHLTGFGFEHHAQPSVISVSNAAEFGTAYSPAELRALADLAHEHGMRLHVDGARIANAAVSQGVSLREIVTDAGVDALSFGGTKNGMLAGEAVVLLGDARTEALPYIRKQSTQLASKSRFMAAQFIAMFEGDLWERCARNANEMAAYLAAGADALPGVEVTQKVQANEVLVVLPQKAIAPLQERWRFHTWDQAASEVRWVTSWDTVREDVDALLADLAKLID
ncbi:MAG: beta-eliminating lyase-related protein [Actinomycetota bacterium]|jgi:threonine aldolase|nr:beta-eliminating lyase-related protein [Actinomycetota bacterium]